MRTAMNKLGASLLTFTSLALFGALLAGCDPGTNEAEVSADSVEQSQQALTSCGGSVVRNGLIKNSDGTQIGNVQLYYSTATTAICGRATFFSPSNFQICVTNHNDLSQPPKCLSYFGATVGATPDQTLRLYDFGSPSVFVSSPLGTGGTAVYQRTF